MEFIWFIKQPYDNPSQAADKTDTKAQLPAERLRVYKHI